MKDRPASTHSFRNRPELAERRRLMRAYWLHNPFLTAGEVAAEFGVSESTARDARPNSIRWIVTSSRVSEAGELAKRLYHANTPLVDIAAACNWGICKTQDYLESFSCRKKNLPQKKNSASTTEP